MTSRQVIGSKEAHVHDEFWAIFILPSRAVLLLFLLSLALVVEGRTPPPMVFRESLA